MHLPSPSPVKPAPQNSPILKAALWDMDGTLIDTEPHWISAEHELVAAHGGLWTEEMSQAVIGSALERTAVLLQGAGVDLSIREIIDFLSNKVIEGVRRDFPWRPGALELLAALREDGVRLALVTMSEGPLAAEVLSALPQHCFEVVVTGDQVEHGKPHPEPYLRAIALLQESDPELDALNCVAFEDSVPGTAAAMASGAATIAVPHLVPLGEDPGRVLWPTLAGCTVADVVEVLAAHRQRSGSTQ